MDLKQEVSSKSPPTSSPPPEPDDDEDAAAVDNDVEQSLRQLHQLQQQQPHQLPEDDQDEEDVVGGGDMPLDMKLKELESRQNLRLYLMKSWNVMQSAANVPELSNSEIRKLLMSPPQSPSINSTSSGGEDAATSAPVITTTTPSRNASIDEPLDSTNDSDTLVMALDEDHVNCSSNNNSSKGKEEMVVAKDAIATTLKTLKAPLNDGIYTYWAVVKTQQQQQQQQNTSATAISSSSSSSANNFGKFINLNRYLSILIRFIKA